MTDEPVSASPQPAQATRTDCDRYDRTRLLRPSWAEIDFSAFRHNVRRARALIGPDVQLHFVLKGDGFGFGATAMARAAERAGVDGFCAGSPDEVVAIRATGTRLPILMFTSTTPDDLAAAAALGCTVTVQSPRDLAALVASRDPVEIFIEIDCGLGRFGLREGQWAEVFGRLREAPGIRLRGIYGHLSSPEDPVMSAAQAALFRRAVGQAAEAGFESLTLMLASSRVVLSYPELCFDAVDPGRLLYGAGLDARWIEAGRLRPLLRAVRSRLIHVQEHPPGTVLGIGYGAPIAISEAMRTAVAPIGFWDGLNNVPPLGAMLVRGVRCPVLGRRTFQHSLLDVTAVPDAAPGDAVTVIGRQGDEEITIDDLAAAIGVPVIELAPRLARSLPHVYHGLEDEAERDGAA